MKYFYVISNLSKDYVLDVQDEVQSCLEKRGAVCRYMTDYERMKNGRHTPGEYVPEDTQCIITIGGDGTLIQAARDLAGRNIPMLGINRGHLGFLNQVDHGGCSLDVILVSTQIVAVVTAPFCTT